MIRILIIDDMKWVREGIKKMLEGFPGKIEISGSVASAQEALHAIAQMYPHIIITDISMPGMDGLELSQIIREKYPYIKILLVSSYEKFEYAKKAVQLKVGDYLLKPVEKSALHRSLAKIIAEMDIENEQLLEKKNLCFKVKEVNRSIKETDIRKAIESTQDISPSFIADNFGLQNQNFCVLVIKIYRFYTVVRERYSNDFQTACFSIRNIVENLTEGDFHFIPGVQKKDEYILIRYGNIIVDEAGELSFANRLKTMLEQFTCMSMSIGISRVGNNLSHLKLACEEAGYALKYRLLNNKSSCYSYTQAIHRSTIKELLSKDDEKLIYYAVRNSDRNRLTEVITCLFACIVQDTTLSFYCLKNLHNTLVLLYSKLLIEVGADSSLCEPWRLLTTLRLDDYEDLNDIKNELINAFTSLIDVVQPEKILHKSILSEQVKKYFEEHYAEKISLESTAKMFFISPCYLGELFKSETKYSFYQYLTMVRMEKARKLLEYNNIKICDVASRVGYNSVSHFIKSFKKVYNLTPDQLKKQK